MPPRRINEIVQGKRGISADTALRLARFFGTSERFWANLQARFDLESEKDRPGRRLDRLEGEANKAYRELYRPVREMVRALIAQRRPREARAVLRAGRSIPYGRPDWKKAVTYRTEHYVLHAKQGDDLPRLGRLLESARDRFPAWIGRPEPRKRRLSIYIFDDREEYDRYFGEDRRIQGRYLYVGKGERFIVMLRADTETDTISTLVHEAMHDWLRRIVKSPPEWLDEGLAEYVSSVEVRGDEVIHIGLTDKGRLRTLLKSDDFLPWKRVLTASHESFHGPARSMYYAQSWAMVHFLAERRRSLLEACIHLAARGQEASDAFDDIDLEALEREWKDYVESLK